MHVHVKDIRWGNQGTHGLGRDDGVGSVRGGMEGGRGWGVFEDSQSGCKEAALVFGLICNIDSFDEMHIQNAALQESDGF